MKIPAIREYLWEHMVSCVNEYENNGITNQEALRKHKNFINRNNIMGKSRYKTLQIMENYFKCPDAKMSQVVFVNTLNNTCMGRVLVPLFAPAS